MTDREYALEKMEEASKLMTENTGNGNAYEFYKGQFLAYRKIAKPEYRGTCTN